MADVTARLAGEKDGREVTRLVSALMVELGGRPLDPESAAKTWSHLCSEPELGFAVLGESAGQSHSVCTVSFAHAMRSTGRYAIVQEMYVTPALRSSGVGRQVLELALRAARERGCAFVELATPLEGERQIAFYRRSGFAVIGERLRRPLS
jgi:ribosomal protein S18 acetylase RimI-like enzyme